MKNKNKRTFSFRFCYGMTKLQKQQNSHQIFVLVLKVYRFDVIYKVITLIPYLKLPYLSKYTERSLIETFKIIQVQLKETTSSKRIFESFLIYYHFWNGFSFCEFMTIYFLKKILIDKIYSKYYQ